VNSAAQKCLPALAELFREHGFEGTSISMITRATGLGKGSLYHAFPEGKAQMLALALDDISAWFENDVFAPLRAEECTAITIPQMIDIVGEYFKSGRRACLMGSLSVAEPADPFNKHILQYFSAWKAATVAALERDGRSDANGLADDILATIQGAIVLSRALEDPEIYDQSMQRLKNRL
jgi:AcrR family transcriptional regulator